jgi:2-amino-4-hydroxy-6-hydroxymethyldihydropteridine diphosphokinase
VGSNLHKAFVGLGGNMDGPLGGPREYIIAALDRLGGSEGIESLRSSGLYRTAPWGKSDQHDFLNAVAELHCTLDAEALLDTLLELELELGRRRGKRWGPRLIDLDLLSFDILEHQNDRLTLPHPRMHQRAFVLVPLLELEPEFLIPGRGRADDCLAALEDSLKVERA